MTKMNAKLKLLAGYLLLSVVCLLVVTRLYFVVHPLAGLSLPQDAAAIRESAERLLRECGIQDQGYISTVRLASNTPLVRQSTSVWGREIGGSLLREGVPGFSWDVQWQKGDDLTISFGNEDKPSRQASENAARAIAGDMHMVLDTRGRVIEFNRNLPDSLTLPTLPADQARTLAESFIRRFSALTQGDSVAPRIFIPETGLALSSQKALDRPARTDYRFTWMTMDTLLNDTVKAELTVAGNAPGAFSMTYVVPAKFSAPPEDSAYNIGILLLSILVIVCMIVVAVRRIRAYEIGYRGAFAAGLAALVWALLEMYFRMPDQTATRKILLLTIAPLFSGVGAFLAWAIAESIGREMWKEKFLSFDLLTRGHFLHSKVGETVVRGMGLGAAALALWFILAGAFGGITDVWYSLDSGSTLRFASSTSPGLEVLSNSLYAQTFTVAVLVIFCISLLRGWISSRVMLFALGAVIVGIANRGNMHPLPIGILVETLVGLIFVRAFLKFDALTSYISLVTFSTAFAGCTLIFSGNETYLHAGELLVALFGLALVLAFAGILTKDRDVDPDRITPAFAKHISERERLQRELEIAREVQMSFLPRENPRFPGLEIAARCAPALEVGGDYYDFIQRENGKFGVAVGDVSGKGTQAAFYMTLTKGFLKAVAGLTGSPAEVLTQANKLFCENVERGTFISLVYGVFDMDRRTLTVARAGHNPVITRKTEGGKTETLQPTGLALGLEGGEKFAKTIQNVTVPFARGDLFVFYTDGFTEAMNSKSVEFGEERLYRAVEQYGAESAESVVEGIFHEIGSFVGRAPQHDDMTIVVVKIT